MQTTFRDVIGREPLKCPVHGMTIEVKRDGEDAGESFRCQSKTEQCSDFWYCPLNERLDLFEE